MKKLIFLMLFIIHFVPQVSCQTRMTSTGSVTFFSDAPLEDIVATNKKVRAAVNIKTGEILIRMRVEDFQFKKSLMQRHFNEEYLESHLYHEALFSGHIIDFNLNSYAPDKTEVFAEGDMTIHGVKNHLKVKGTIQTYGNKLVCEAVFPVRVADYGVKIPGIFVKNIAEIVEVTVKLELE